MYRSVESIIDGLESQGFVFSQSVKILEGNFEPSDAEWNYTDVPHLKEIHKLVEGVPGAIDHNYWAGIFVQRIGPIRIPITVFNYAFDRFCNIYFGSIGPFALIIKSKWESLGNSATKVTTEYSLGSLSYLRILHPVVHRLLGRNYRMLMADDLPMRLRRGELRARGYQFKGDSDGNGFLESLNTATNGVLAPLSAPTISWAKEIGSIPEGSTLIGSDDVSGVRIVRSGKVVTLYPRICLHAGANLDEAVIIDDCLVCPWHGKAVKALAKVTDTGINSEFAGSGISATCNGTTLEVTGKILI